MALLEDKPRSARVSTVTATTLLAVTRQRFNTLIEQHRQWRSIFSSAISAQLRQQYQEQAILLEEKQTLVEALAAKNAALEQTLAKLQAALVAVAEHERVKRDLEIAREIQLQMLPPRFQAPGLRLHATTVPTTWVGEDYMMPYARGQPGGIASRGRVRERHPGSAANGQAHGRVSCLCEPLCRSPERYAGA
jgi:hypothetical protein